jgi:hypothetical protein
MKKPMIKPMIKFDVVITGKRGFYEIAPLTCAGKAWRDEHLSKCDSERTRMGESVMCEGLDNCEAIVAGMNRDGLKVTMNGVDMKGFGTE